MEWIKGLNYMLVIKHKAHRQAETFVSYTLSGVDHGHGA